MTRVIILCLALILIGCKSSENLLTVENKQLSIKDEISPAAARVLTRGTTKNIVINFSSMLTGVRKHAKGFARQQPVGCAMLDVHRKSHIPLAPQRFIQKAFKPKEPLNQN